MKIHRCWRCRVKISLDDRHFDDGLCNDCFHDPSLFKELDETLGRIDKEIAKDKHRKRL